MADIEKLKPFILKWEGGYSNKKNDKGGATNKGVTLATFRAYFGSTKNVADLKKITDEEWLYILRKGYWSPFKADNILSQSVANICVDWAWNSGATTAIKRVQTVLGVDSDGRVGNQSLTAINRSDSRELFSRIKAARISFAYKIVEKDPSQKEFLQGWLNRINSLEYES